MRERSSDQVLRYMLQTMQQISAVLRDFELEQTAALLDVASKDLELRLPDANHVAREKH